VIASPRISDTKEQIERDWSLLDVLHAHMALDVHEQLEAKVYGGST